MLYEVVTNRFQKAGFRNRVASALAKSDEVLSENGYVRQFSNETIGYETIRIFDEKPELITTDELQLTHKKYVITSYSIHYTKLYDYICATRLYRESLQG